MVSLLVQFLVKIFIFYYLSIYTVLSRGMCDFISRYGYISCYGKDYGKSIEKLMNVTSVFG